jgi:spore germination cell wall hydrolase CwlJ-like protein
MLVSLRSALLVIAAASASSVAPAQVGPSSEPLIPVTQASLPTVVVPEKIEYPALPDSMDPVESETTDKIPQTEAAPVKPTGDLSSLVAQMRGSDAGSRELECLAAGVYFESKSEPLAGQLAVGQVIANRANSHGRFPSSYCGVLFQRGQFSFIRGGHWPAVNRSGRQWQNAVAIAKIVDQDLKDSEAENALFFHAKRVSPGWRLKRVTSIGNHVFYR